MRLFTVEQSTLVYKASFARALPGLPTPGTVWFAALVKDLSPHGLSPAGIELEAPTSRLDDVVLGLSLLGNRLRIKLSYGWFEFVIGDLYDDDEPALIEIATCFLKTLREIDEAFQQDSAQYRSYAHLKVTRARDLISEHLSNNGRTELLPDAFAYQLKWDELKEREHARIVVANSSRLDDGLFIDLTIDYQKPSEPVALVERMNADYERALGLLGLQILS